MTIAQQQDRRRLTADAWLQIKRVGAPAITPDGRRMVVAVTTLDLEENVGRDRLYLFDRGEARPLTAPELSASQPAISPDGRLLAFVRQPAGAAQKQLCVMPMDGGESRGVTDLPLGVSDPHWLPDSSGVVFLSQLYREAPTPAATAERKAAQEKAGSSARVTDGSMYRFWDHFLTDGEVHHLFLYRLADASLRDLTPDQTHDFDFMDAAGQFDIAPHGRELVFSANATSDGGRPRMALYTVGIEDGAICCISPTDTFDYTRPRYSPDGTHIVYGLLREWEVYDRIRIGCYDRTSGSQRTLTETWQNPAAEWAFVPASDTLLVLAENRGRTTLYRMRLDGQAPVEVATGGTFAGLSAAADGSAYVKHHGLVILPQVSRIDSRGQVEALTDFQERFDVGTVEERFVNGVQTFMLLPPDFDKSRRWPLVHVIHGGPHGTFGDVFHPRWSPQVLAAAGYVVAMVNFHGSTSFGDDYARSIVGRWGDEPFEDIMAATDDLLAQGYIDEQRMAVTGGSYGGYLSAWMTCRTNRFACAIVHAGVMDFHLKYATDWVHGVGRNLGAWLWDDPEAADRYSPTRLVGQVTTPTLVIHGEQDYRVPVAQGLMWYNMLKMRNVPARLVYYPDENHWISKPRNAQHWYGEFLGWLERWLKA